MKFKSLSHLLLVGLLSSHGCVISKTNEGDYRYLSNSFVKDLMENSRKQSYEKMTSEYRAERTISQFESDLEQIFSSSGNPIDCDYKKVEITKESFTKNQTSSRQRYWYACGTSKFTKGTYFLIVEIKGGMDDPRVASFQIVNFPNGPPPYLQ